MTKTLFAFIAGCMANVAALTQDTNSIAMFISVGQELLYEGDRKPDDFMDVGWGVFARKGVFCSAGLVFPNAQQIAKNELVLLYGAGASDLSAEEKENLKTLFAKGGGLVVMSDALVNDTPDWLADLCGAAVERGRTLAARSSIEVAIDPTDHPITRGVPDFTLNDLVFLGLEPPSNARVLASATIKGIETPVLWVLEKGESRLAVCQLPHEMRNLANPSLRVLLLRTVAWAAKRASDFLVTEAELKAMAPVEGPPQPK